MLLKQWTHILEFSVLQSKDGQFFPVIDIKEPLVSIVQSIKLQQMLTNVSIIITCIIVIENDTQNVRIDYSIMNKSGKNKEEYLQQHCLPSNNSHGNFIYPFLHLLMPIMATTQL